MTRPRPRARLVRHIGLVAGLTVIAVGVALAIVLPVFRFPRPTGPHEVGTVTYHWTDRSRPEILTAAKDDFRELMVQVWYPAETSAPASARARYLPDAGSLTSALGRVFGIPPLALRSLGAVTTHAVPNAPVAGAGRYPVLIFLEGLGGFRQMNTFQVEELASHGFVVVALDQPYTAASVAFPDGKVAAMSSVDEMRPLVRQSYLPAPTPPVLHGRELPHGVLPYLAQDVSYVLDRLADLDRTDPILTGRLDLDRAGAFGTSLGGIVAGEAGRTDPRLKALLIMDAPVPLQTVRSGLDQPTMWITRPADTMREERERIGGWAEDEIEAHHTTMRACFDGLRASGYFVQIPRMSHLDFTDVPLWSPVFGWMGATGPIDGRRAHRLLNEFGLAFFDRHLRARPAPFLDGPRPGYEDVTVEWHAPPRGEERSS